MLLRSNGFWGACPIDMSIAEDTVDPKELTEVRTRGASKPRCLWVAGSSSDDGTFGLRPVVEEELQTLGLEILETTRMVRVS